MKTVLSRFTYANVMSTLAVVLLLAGGTAYGAGHLPKNSVTSRQVKNGSLLAKDFKASQLPNGGQGSQGIQGIQGVKGDTGPSGLSNYQVVTSAPFPNPSGGQSAGQATCPPGTKPLGGGAVGSLASTDQNINSSVPQGQSWGVDMNNASGFSATFIVIVVCATVSP